MAVINNPIAQRPFEVIRDRIANILADELWNQSVINYDESLDATIYTERFVPFDRSDMPCVNVMLTRGNFDNYKAIDKDGTYQFFIDVYHRASTTDSVGADEMAHRNLHRLIGVIDAILSDTRYVTLGYERPFISRVEVTEIKIAEPKDDHDAQSVAMGRVFFSVRVPSSVESIQPRLMAGYDTQVKIGTTDIGYIYSGANIPVPEPTCEPVLIYLANGTVIATVNSGGEYYIPDTPVTVTDQDGNELGSDNVPSVTGGNIEVNIPECADATANVFFEDELVGTATIPSGDTGQIDIGCSTLMNAVKVVSTWQQHKHGGTFKHIGEVNGKPAYEALHDPTKTIEYSGSNWQLIKTGSGAHVHNAVNGNDDFPWLATWLDSYLTVTQATVGSFCTNGGIAYYNLVDTDGNLLAEGSISEGDEDDIVALDVSINVNGTTEGSVVSGGTAAINLVDGSGDPVTPDSVTVVGDMFTVEVPSGGGCTGTATLMKSGLETSFRDFDDGSEQLGRLTDWFTLSNNNAFGNTNRFTDELGGSTYTNNIVLDNSTDDCVSETILGYYRVRMGSNNLDNSIAAAKTLNIAGFTGWNITNIVQGFNLLYWEQPTNLLNYTPFNIGASQLWTNTGRAVTTGFIIQTYLNQVINVGAEGSSYHSIACRLFTYAELGL